MFATELQAFAGEGWEIYLNHPFFSELGEGTLSPDRFDLRELEDLDDRGRDHCEHHIFALALFNVYMVSHIEDGLLRQEIVKKLIELRPENADFIRYADSLSAPL